MDIKATTTAPSTSSATAPATEATSTSTSTTTSTTTSIQSTTNYAKKRDQGQETREQQLAGSRACTRHNSGQFQRRLLFCLAPIVLDAKLSEIYVADPRTEAFFTYNISGYNDNWERYGLLTQPVREQRFLPLKLTMKLREPGIAFPTPASRGLLEKYTQSRTRGESRKRRAARPLRD